VVQLRVSLCASTPKDPEQPSLNEDAWQADQAGQRWALSDGASESYDSQAWARALVEKYVLDPSVSAEWVRAAVAVYRGSVDFDSLSWSQQAAFDRGSFATLLGVELAPNNADLEVLAIGDSLALHVRRGALLSSYPYQSPEQFELRPQLLSTDGTANKFVEEQGFITNNSCKTWSLEPGDIVYLVTDAVGQWALSELASQPSSLDILDQLSSDEDLQALVLQLRAEKRMRLDDSTVVRLIAEGS
jgi:hypothetical protein